MIDTRTMIKAGSALGGSAVTIVGIWLFLTSYFSLAADVEQREQAVDDLFIMMNIDISEDRLFRLQSKADKTSEEIAKEKQLERRIYRLEKQLGDPYEK